MLTHNIESVLVALQHGQFDPALMAMVESLSARVFVDDLRLKYGVVFQERVEGAKREIGLAHRLTWALTAEQTPKSMFPSMRMLPSLERCLLISSYNDEISELTWANRIQLRRSRVDKNGLVLRFGKGSKLDNTIDGWSLSPFRTVRRLCQRMS